MTLIQVQSKDMTTNKISNTMKALFLSFHIIFALDFGSLKYQTLKVEIVLKLLLFLKCVIFCVLVWNLLQAHRTDKVIWDMVFLSHYCIIVFSVLCGRSEKSHFKLQKDLLSIDKELNVTTRSYKMEIKMLCFIFYCFLFNATMVLLVGFNDGEECVKNVWGIIYTMFTSGSQIPIILNFFSFYSVYCRLKKLKWCVINNTFKLKKNLFIYRNICNSLQTIKICVDISVSIASIYIL